MIQEYINDKIEMTEEICGRMTIAEKNDMRESFIKTFTDFADEIGVDVNLIFDDIDLLAELDELIAYDFELAKNTAIEALGGV